jgi:hypothetical protein
MRACRAFLHGIPHRQDRLSTCYSPVRHSRRAEAPRAFDLHVLRTPPALVLSQDQTRHPSSLHAHTRTHLRVARARERVCSCAWIKSASYSFVRSRLKDYVFGFRSPARVSTTRTRRSLSPSLLLFLTLQLSRCCHLARKRLMFASRCRHVAHLASIAAASDCSTRFALRQGLAPLAAPSHPLACRPLGRAPLRFTRLGGQLGAAFVFASSKTR